MITARFESPLTILPRYIDWSQQSFDAPLVATSKGETQNSTLQTERQYLLSLSAMK
jgi:hypothetical protein